MEDKLFVINSMRSNLKSSCYWFIKLTYDLPYQYTSIIFYQTNIISFLKENLYG